jgi:hypothetical protein
MADGGGGWGDFWESLDERQAAFEVELAATREQLACRRSAGVRFLGVRETGLWVAVIHAEDAAVRVESRTGQGLVEAVRLFFTRERGNA